jgi:dihydrofolate reductase
LNETYFAGERDLSGLFCFIDALRLLRVAAVLYLNPGASALNNTTLVRDVVKEAVAIKRRFGREVQVHGSCGLAQTLIEYDLVDEYRLLVFPVLLGTGKRLFGSGAVPRTLKLVRSSTTSTGVVVSVYRPAGDLKTGSFALDQ